MSEEMLQQCGDWRLEREIGQGAYGVVYLAVGPGGERAAVKVCRREAVGDERHERELRGAKLYRTIPPQEGLVRMRELVETEWGFYTVMDLADDEFGGPQEATSGYRPKTLAKVIEGEKALPLKECVRLGIALAKGLTGLQRHHLLHRDIKPGNVLYVGGRSVLSDPGLVVEESVAVSTVGTPGYLPPERKFTDSSGDIYSLGLTLKAASFGRKLEDLDKGPALEADTSSAGFPAWWKILNKATALEPSRRYQSAKALLKDLKSLRHRLAVAAITRSWMFYAAMVIFAASVVVSLYMASGRQAQKAARDARVALLRNALRQTFDGISEERLSAMVEKEEKELEREEQPQKRTGKNAEPDSKPLTDIKEFVSDLEGLGEKPAAVREDRGRFWRTYNNYCFSEYSIYRDEDLKKNADEALRKVEKTKRFADKIRGEIAEIAVVDKKKADDLQTCFNNAIERGAKLEDICKRIGELRKKAQEKTESGLDDKEEFLLAKKIAEEEKLRDQTKELKDIVDKLTGNRRSYLYAVRNKWNHYIYCLYPPLNEYVVQRDIDRIAAVDKSKAAILQDRLNKYLELCKKQESLWEKKDELRKAGERKAKEGLDDMAEFRQAEKICEEERKLFYGEIKPLSDEINAMRRKYVEDLIDDI